MGFWCFFYLIIVTSFAPPKEVTKKKRPEMITSAFFGKMPLASRAQKRLKFAPFPVSQHTAVIGILFSARDSYVFNDLHTALYPLPFAVYSRGSRD